MTASGYENRTIVTQNHSWSSSFRIQHKLGLGKEDTTTVSEETYLRYIFILLYCTIFSMGVVGNFAVISERWRWRIRTFTDFCFANLSLSQLGVAFFCMFQNLMSRLYHGWKLGTFLCQMYHYMEGVNFMFSVLIFGVAALERYLTIIWGFNWRQAFTTRACKLLILALWIISFTLPFHRWFSITTFSDPIDEVTYICGVLSETGSYVHRVVECFPLTILVLTYFLNAQMAVYLWCSASPCLIPTGTNVNTAGTNAANDDVELETFSQTVIPAPGPTVNFRRSSSVNSMLTSSTQILSLPKTSRQTERRVSLPGIFTVHGLNETVYGTRPASFGGDKTAIPNITPHTSSVSTRFSSSSVDEGNSSREEEFPIEGGFQTNRVSTLRVFESGRERLMMRYRVVVKTLCVVTVIFTACNLPMQVLQFYSGFEGSNSIHAVASILTYTCCAAIPFIFVLMTQQIGL